MLYAVDDDLNLYFATHAESYKSKNAQENPVISVSVWEHQKMLIQLDGDVETITNPDEQAKVLDMLADASTKEEDFWPPVFRIKGGDYAVFKIKPTWMRALDLENSNVHQEDSPFSEINLD
jgi:nitroimidazol reductase NimA-like FMN-containing flavoprotein (pyridoxamine 5'-phosphate oxidase superfamily)